MFKTLTFNEMNVVQKIDWLSDQLGEACISVNGYKRYIDLTPEEKAEVKKVYHSYLDREGVELTHSLIEEVEKEFTESPIGSLLRQYGYKPTSEASDIEKAYITLNNLAVGEKITIVKFSDFGFPVCIQTTFNNITLESYAQYKESLKIVHKPKRKRNLYGNRILPNENLTVYKGWIDIDTEKATYNTLEDNKFSTVKQSKYGCFDDQFINDIVKINKQDPIVNIG